MKNRQVRTVQGGLWPVCPARIWQGEMGVGDDGKRPLRALEWERRSKREMGTMLCSFE